MSIDRGLAASASIDGKIYVMGGMRFNGGIYDFTGLKTIEAYDPLTNTWDSTLADMPTKKWGHSAVAFNGKIYVFGRWGASLIPVEVYDPQTNTWVTISNSNIPTPRYCLTTCVLDNNIYAIGGWYNSGSGPIYDKVEVYTPGSNTWYTETPMPVALAVLASIVIDGKIQVFGGSYTTHPLIGTSGIYEFSNNDPLPAGTYTNGSGGYFSSIQSAFDKLSTDGVAGNVTLELIDDLYTAPTGQYGFSLNGPIPGAGPNSRVTIKPAANKNVTIEGNCFANLYFPNTSYLTIDGVSLTGTSTLTIHALYNIQFQWNDCIEFVDNSDNNVIQNTIFICEDITRQGDGIVFFNSDAAVLFTPDSNLIQNNFIKEAGLGIYVGNYFSNDLRPQGNVIRGNKIGSETDSLIAWGINTDHTQNTIVENNIIQNVRYYQVDYPNPGISSYWDYNCIIRNNVVHNIYTSAGPRGASGILLYGLTGQTGSDNLVYNNMIYDIRSSSTRVAGINIRFQNNPKAYYNSVYLSGTGNGANTEGSAALCIGIEVTNLDAKNNIFVNTRDESPYCASAIYDYTASNLTTNYNDLFYEPNQYNCLVRAGGDDYLTLADWQATGQDLNSVTEMPNFVAPDLHIDGGILTLLDGHATPITGIDTDFDGETRNITTPDIGADEFLIVSVEEEANLPTEFALEQNYPNPFNPSTKISWQSPVGSQQTLKIFDVLGNEIATLADEYKPAGKYEVEFNASTLPSGVYFYQLKAGDFIQTNKMILMK
jgi:hypothetical protein